MKHTTLPFATRVAIAAGIRFGDLSGAMFCPECGSRTKTWYERRDGEVVSLLVCSQRCGWQIETEGPTQ